MELEAAESLCKEYSIIYEEKDVVNKINDEKFFLNSLKVVHLPPFDENSYDVNVIAIKEGNVITFALKDAINIFGKEF